MSLPRVHPILIMVGLTPRPSQTDVELRTKPTLLVTTVSEDPSFTEANCENPALCEERSVLFGREGSSSPLKLALPANEVYLNSAMYEQLSMVHKERNAQFNPPPHNLYQPKKLER